MDELNTGSNLHKLFMVGSTCEGASNEKAESGTNPLSTELEKVSAYFGQPWSFRAQFLSYEMLYFFHARERLKKMPYVYFTHNYSQGNGSPDDCGAP